MNYRLSKIRSTHKYTFCLELYRSIFCSIRTSLVHYGRTLFVPLHIFCSIKNSFCSYFYDNNNNNKAKLLLGPLSRMFIRQKQQKQSFFYFRNFEQSSRSINAENLSWGHFEILHPLLFKQYQINLDLWPREMAV